jgi:glutamate-ammonia-ligase adenylyltransferase
VSKVTFSKLSLSDNLKPNSNWSDALTELETILTTDLFQLLIKSSDISRFVAEVFCQYPTIAAQTLIWQVESKDSDEALLALNFEDFCLGNLALTESQIMQRLRIFRRCHAAAIALLELTNTISIETSCSKISALADVMIHAAYKWCYQSMQQKFGSPLFRGLDKQNLVILAMGKLGGKELNFSSDVDLIFFYSHSGETTGESRQIENSKFFHRLSTQLIKLLDEVTADGFVYRIDMRLRPYGDSGALVASFAQAEDYYQEQGREWERFAMVRARTLTGSLEERKLINEIIRPFSFRRYIDYGVIESIRSMKEMIQREVRRKGLVGNIKLGAGGIREIEFIVQSLQLIQGGRDKRLCERNTLKVLPLLVDAKLLPAEVAENLSDSYRFLRRLEHCIQELAEKQTQQLPKTDTEQFAICVALNFPNWPALTDHLRKIQESVNQSFSELFGEARKKALAQDEFYLSLAEGHIDAEQLLNYMQNKRDDGAHEVDIETYQNFIHQLNLFAQESSVINLTPRGAKRVKVFFPTLLAACLLTEKPDLTLARLLKVLQAILKRTAYLELLSENPPVLQHLVDLAGQSEWIAKRLSDYPVLFDELLYPSSLYEPLQTADLRSELQQNLLRINPEDEEELLDTVRAFKQTNELRVAAALLAQRLSISQVSRYLTQLAEVVLQAAVKQCWHLLKIKHGVPSELEDEASYGFGVIGYGKLGGFELGFGSDLDLVFLFDQSVEGQTNGKRSINNSRFYTRLAQKIIHFLSTRTNLGLLYEVDMRLRPSGSSGLLVSHTDAYQEYQMEAAWTWEHQALVRARFVAGDEKINHIFEKVRFAALTLKRDISKLQADVREMRDKMRQQLEKKEVNLVDLKQAKGGLVDIEFLAQYFSLLSPEKPSTLLQSPPCNTAEGLKQAAINNRLSQTDSLVLIKNYRVFRNKLNEKALLEGGSMVESKLFSDKMKQVAKIWESSFPNHVP